MSGKQLDHDPKPCWAATDLGVHVAYLLSLFTQTLSINTVVTRFPS